jgi:hypothetical protein
MLTALTDRMHLWSDCTQRVWRRSVCVLLSVLHLFFLTLRFVSFRFLSPSPPLHTPTHASPMDQTTGSALPGTPIPSSFTFNSSSFRRSYAEPSSSSSSSSAPSHKPPTSAYLRDDFERQRHQRQNQEIIRLCALKSIQIRQSEAKLSELENENLDLRTALRNAKRKLETNIDKPPSLSPPQHGRERSSAEDGSGIYSTPYLAKQGRAVSPEECSGIDNSRYEEEFDQEQELANQHGRGFKRHRTRSSESSFSSMQFLLSKLDQVQTVFEVTQVHTPFLYRTFTLKEVTPG